MKYNIMLLFAALAITAYFIDYSGIGRSFSSSANANSDKRVVVVELYTSQSCSSCPPADKVLSEIADEPHIIALACHVTYWNHLSWKDTLSKQECTNRQRSFNGERGSNRIYTPQMVVNGLSEFVGSRRGKAISTIHDAQPLKKVALQKNGTTIVAKIPTITTSGEFYIEWIGFDTRHSQDINAGENRGRSITYNHPIRSIDYQFYDKNQKEFTYNPDTKTDRIAILIRKGKAGPIVAAGQLTL